MSQQQKTNPDPSSQIRAANPAAMDHVGARLASVLQPGDVLAISGPLGAGKSHLCRAVIRHLLSDPDAAVPSPSYTLVNVYETHAGPVWHADLYRINDPEELAELGLDDTSRTILLVEWPERWKTPPRRRANLTICVQPDDSRIIDLSLTGQGWNRLHAVWEELV